uniref:Actin-binding Rho-activating protein n=1 Tax=Mola mola TaxID=94237 RepID=A0A3Q3XF87_MOLML
MFDKCLNVRRPGRAFKRAVRKIKCTAMVASLAKSWQGWANEHTERQDSIPSGWMPSSVEDESEKEQKQVVKLTVTPRVIAADAGDSGGGSKIRAGAVTKTVRPKRSECSSLSLVNAIRDKMESVPEGSKPFLGNESPTRRRQMRALQRSGDASATAFIYETAEVMGNVVQITKLTIKIATMGDVKSRWQQWSEQHIEGQKLNPFSEEFDHDYAMAQRLRRGDSGYGRPKEGSKTAQRGDRAQKHIHREMEEMVWIIRDMGNKDRQGRTFVTFGRLFDRYVKISDKVVGILLRCRKHKMLDFEGEMLWKGQDDRVIITLRD